MCAKDQFGIESNYLTEFSCLALDAVSCQTKQQVAKFLWVVASPIY